MIVYKDILQKLKAAGYNTNRLRKEKIIGQGTLTKIRNNEPINLEKLNLICKLTGLPVEELIEYQEEYQDN